MNQYTANEFFRILAVITETDPTTQEYHIALQSLECFVGIADSIEEIMEQIAQGRGEESDLEGKIVKIEVDPKALKQQVQEEPAEEPDPEPAAEPAAELEPAETYDLVTVRAAMREAKKRGVDIKELIQSFGATNLTDLPAEKYGELMKKLEADG